MNKKSVAVASEKVESGRTNIYLWYPTPEESLDTRETAFLLAQGLSLCVKLHKEDTGREDHELMSEIINLLNHEFASSDSFKDAEIMKKSSLSFWMGIRKLFDLTPKHWMGNIHLLR